MDIIKIKIIILDDLAGLEKNSFLLKEIRDAVITKNTKNRIEPYTPNGENLLNKFPDCEEADSLDQPSGILSNTIIYKNANMEMTDISNNE
jgi:hypothetical protein